MCLSKRAVKEITSTLTSMDIVKTVSYAMFPRTDLNLSKLGFINKAIIFGTGVSSDFDCRSPREWEEQARRFLARGAIATHIVVPVLQFVDRNGKKVKELKSYRDAHLFPISSTYGDDIELKPQPQRFIDLKEIAKRYDIDLGELPAKVSIFSYYNERECAFEIADEAIKRFIYKVVCRTIKNVKMKHQQAKDALICEITTLAILRAMGKAVNHEKDYHERIGTYGLYQRLSTLPCYFSILKGIEKLFDLLELPMIEE